MTGSQHLLILANSNKHSGLCVAGRQIVVREGRCYLGPWTRPVSDHPHGELMPTEIALAGGGRPRVLDIVEVPLRGPARDPTQPENWRVRPRVAWRMAAKQYRRPPLELLIEKPANLWLEEGERKDRVSADHLAAHPPEQSLYLLQVQNLHARFDWNDREGFYRERYRAMFSYQGENYELNITDPRFIARHKPRLLPPDQPSVAFSVNEQRDTTICVSLAREFNGYHYKVVATIFS